MLRKDSFTERRRRQLALRIATLDKLESRNSIGDMSSPLGMAFQAVTTAGLYQWLTTARDEAAKRSSPTPKRPATAMHAPAILPITAAPPKRGKLAKLPITTAQSEGDWLTFNGAGRQLVSSQAVSFAEPSALLTDTTNLQNQPQNAGTSHPSKNTGGGVNRSGTRGAITPLRIPPPGGIVTPPVLIAPQSQPNSPLDPAPVPIDTRTFIKGDVGADDGGTFSAFGDGSGEINTLVGLAPVELGAMEMPWFDGGSPLEAFSSYPIYTLDYNNGVVLFPEFYQLGVKGTSVDLRAQVRDAAPTVTFDWDTTGLTHATSISGGSTYNLTFDWQSSITFPPGESWVTDTVTLTVTDGGSLVEEQTYTFAIPSNASGSGGGYSWPNTLPPNLVQPNSAAFASHYVDVEANSGSLNTSIDLPAYNPNFAGTSMRYDSIAADQRPLIVVHHPLDDSLSIPTKTSAKLTFNGSGGTTYYYDTSVFTPGDIAQFSLQVDATALATGRYDYSVEVVDYRGSNTTTTYNGTATVLSKSDEPFNSLGPGWSVAGLAKLFSVSGGVILNLGSNDSLWFATLSSGGGTTTFTTPAGDFSTLTKNESTNVYTRTLNDGTSQVFNSGGSMTAFVDRNGLRVTYTYNSNRLTKITDPYNKVTTLVYSGGKVRTIEDPANRVTTITFSGGNLTGVTKPDGSTWAYTYDSGGRMTLVTDPRSKAVTIAYDSANRVNTITRPDGTTQSFDPYQAEGYDTSGTSGSPAPAILLAEATAAHTDPNGNVTNLRTDWYGLGRINQLVDAAGYVATADLDPNGLPTVTIDRLNRITRASFSGGNVTEIKLADMNTQGFTYNSFSQVTEFTNERTYKTTYTYDSGGNLTRIKDALNNLTTLTYTGNGRVQTVQDARGNTTSFQYDSQDRLTTITYPGTGTPTTLLAYDTKGNVVTLTNERGNSTTYSYDALNRLTGEKDALGNKATFTFDSGGNLTLQQLPTPSGGTARTTTYSYDSMNRVTTIAAPESRTTVVSYDSGGRLIALSDPLSRVTSYQYDPLNRATTITDPRSENTVIDYDAEGQVTRISDRLAQVTTTTYNVRGWVATETNPRSKTVTYTYSATGRLATQSQYTGGGDPGGTVTELTYDALDRLTVQGDALLNKTTYTYDSVGNLVTLTLGNGYSSTYSYDARNRRITATGQYTTTYAYDSGGNVTAVTDPLSHTTSYEYDAVDRMTTITDAEGGIITLVYDEASRQVVVVDPVSNRTTFSYDGADRVTTMTDALGTATYSYDAGDQLTAKSDRLTRQTTFAYDSGGRLTNERWLTSSGGTVRTITYTYDDEDQLQSVSDPDAALTFGYDSGGNITTASTSGGGSGQPYVTLTYSYKPFDGRESMTDSLGSVGRTTYGYDAANRLNSITRTLGGSDGPNVAFTYDGASWIKTIRRAIGAIGGGGGPVSGGGGGATVISTTFTYDSAGRMGTIQHYVEGGAKLATYVYGYDDASRLTTENNAEGLATYSYDDTNQLTGVDRPVGQTDETYGYDLNGNRNTTGYTISAGNTMIASPGYTYTYDAEGNTSAKTETATGKVTTYAYDYRNRLTGATQKNSGGSVIMAATYVYDALGRRIKTDVDADGSGGGAADVMWMVYDGVNTYADFNSGGTLLTRYLYGAAVDEILARTTSGGTSAWYLNDKLGSVRDIANTSGTVIDHISYDAFGQILTESSPGNGDRFKFLEKQYDSLAAIYEVDSRVYDPRIGRFASSHFALCSSPKARANEFRFSADDPNNTETTYPGQIEAGGVSVGASPTGESPSFSYRRKPGKQTYRPEYDPSKSTVGDYSTVRTPLQTAESHRPQGGGPIGPLPQRVHPPPVNPPTDDRTPTGKPVPGTITWPNSETHEFEYRTPVYPDGSRFAIKGRFIGTGRHAEYYGEWLMIRPPDKAQ